MKTFQWKSLLPHVIAVAVFLVVALIYCKPTLEGKVLQQHDIIQWKGMAQNSFQYREKHGHFPLWSNGMFSGMPAFQITSVGSNPISIGFVGDVLTLNLPKPISFFFLACVCFYFLSQVLRVNPYIGIFGALSYAYATYNPIIISVGHDTKMLAIAYLPAFVASLLLLYNKKYIWGTALTALFTGLLIAVNHLQITYYGFLVALVISIGFGIDWLKKKEYKRIAVSAGLVVLAALLGVMVNAVSLLTTYEYSKYTIRGGSELADGKSSTTKTGLTKDYAMSYSMYKTEPLVMMFPRIYGGSSGNLEVSEDKSKAIQSLQEMPQQLGQVVQGALQFYWGGIYENGGTAGPPYIGAIVCFLALIGFVILDGKHKWWILAACILTIVMSWGKYFEGFNSFLLSSLPMYNKFRAPSMIIVVPTLLLSMMAIMALNKIITDPDREQLFLKYKKGLIIAGSVFVLALLVYFMSDFTGQSDKQFNEQFMPQIANIPDQQQKASIEGSVKSFFSALREDRKGLFMGSIMRTFLFVAIAAIGLLLYLKRKINAMVVTIALGAFSFIDLIVIDNFYLNDKHYQDAGDYDSNFKPTAIDEQILKDTGYYRVFDFTYGASAAFNGGALPSYFHKSIGGYHPAKLSIYQDLIEKQLYQFPNCLPVIDMLNTKYIIASQNGQQVVQQNPNALGAVWFVKGITYEKNQAAVMTALSDFNPKDTALLDESYRGKNLVSSGADSTASIKLVYNDNDIIEYQSTSKNTEFAVFSEVYYDAGWVATIDGKEAPIIRTNYVLRGLQVPAGNHRIVFEFKPASYYRGNTAAIGASAVIWLMLIGAVVSALRKPKETT